MSKELRFAAVFALAPLACSGGDAGSSADVSWSEAEAESEGWKEGEAVAVAAGEAESEGGGVRGGGGV